MPELSTEPKSFWSEVWDRTKAVCRWLGTRLLAPGVALVVVVIAIVLIAMGVKGLQIGGLLGWLFGKKEPGYRAIDTANSIPSNRIDANGNLIQPGTPDSKGVTQAVVVQIQEPGIFSNPDTVTFVPPGADKPIEVKLPDGVKNKDVEKVIVVQPEKFVVTVKDTSGVSGQHVDDLLAKYGGT